MFITICTENREPVFAQAAYARAAVESLYRIQCFNAFYLYAFVVMPDHCHFLMYVPEKSSISKIMYAYKTAVAFEAGRPLWQSRFFQKIVNRPHQTIKYIHQNPVRRGLCITPDQFQWSSASGRWDVLQLPMM